MDKLIASFDALSVDAQTQLKEQFPFFTKLDEVRLLFKFLLIQIGDITHSFVQRACVIWLSDFFRYHEEVYK